MNKCKTSFTSGFNGGQFRGPINLLPTVYACYLGVFSGKLIHFSMSKGDNITNEIKLLGFSNARRNYVIPSCIAMFMRFS